MTLNRALLAAAILIAILGLAGLTASTGEAGQVGDERWCAVVDQGGGEMTWYCEYETVEDCTPAVLQGNRGFCALNPGWKDPNKQR